MRWVAWKQDWVTNSNMWNRTLMDSILIAGLTVICMLLCLHAPSTHPLHTQYIRIYSHAGLGSVSACWRTNRLLKISLRCVATMLGTHSIPTLIACRKLFNRYMCIDCPLLLLLILLECRVYILPCRRVHVHDLSFVKLLRYTDQYMNSFSPHRNIHLWNNSPYSVVHSN